jgi:hypothetical protein
VPEAVVAGLVYLMATASTAPIDPTEVTHRQRRKLMGQVGIGATVGLVALGFTSVFRVAAERMKPHRPGAVKAAQPPAAVVVLQEEEPQSLRRLSGAGSHPGP